MSGARIASLDARRIRSFEPAERTNVRVVEGCHAFPIRGMHACVLRGRRSELVLVVDIGGHILRIHDLSGGEMP